MQFFMSYYKKIENLFVKIGPITEWAIEQNIINKEEKISLWAKTQKGYWYKLLKPSIQYEKTFEPLKKKLILCNFLSKIITKKKTYGNIIIEVILLLLILFNF